MPLIKIFFQFYHICGYSLIKYPNSVHGKARLTHVSGVGFQLANFLVIAAAYVIGVYRMPQVRTASFRDIPALNTMIIFHVGYGMCFLALCETWWHRTSHKTYMEHLESNQMWLLSQKCAIFYEKLLQTMCYEHLVVTFMVILNEIARIVHQTIVGGDMWYYYYVILVRLMMIFRWLQVLLYTRLILLQQKSVLQLIRLEDQRATKSFFVTLVSQINTKLYVMSKSVSKYFGYSFILLAFSCLLQVSFAMYICALHFLYGEYPDVIPGIKNNILYSQMH